MKSQQVCILDIDVQGVRQVKESGLEGVRYVFIKPPSLEVLEERLRSRGTETEEAIEKVTQDRDGIKTGSRLQDIFARPCLALT